MESKWIKTEKMLRILKQEPDTEQEYRLYLGGILRSTHWFKYSSKKKKIGESTNWFNYYWFSEEEFLEEYNNHWWHKDA